MKTKKLSCLIILLSTFIVALSPLPAFAVSGVFDEDFFSTNRILYYMPGGQACTVVGGSYSTGMDIPLLTGSDNEEKIWNFLIDPSGGGLSEEQAAGVMGNIKQESGFNPDLEEGPDSYNRHDVRPVGYGIVQWTGGRRTALEKAAEDKGVSASNLGFQLAYLVQESQGRQVESASVASRFNVKVGDNEWESLKKQKTLEDALVFWHDAFERSADTPEFVINTRGAYASGAFEKFTGRSAAGGGASSGGGNCSAVGSGDLAATVLEYAWPEFKGSGFIEMMPAYRAVVDKGDRFRDMGGTAYRGVDCVGFVTTLMIDSGFEPNFNYAGKYYGKGQKDDDRGEDIERYWLEDSANGWEKIASKGKKMNGEPFSSADLQPGDVAVSDESRSDIPGHTFAFVGTISGFSSQYASASMDDRAPMATDTNSPYESAANDGFEWYRKVR